MRSRVVFSLLGVALISLLLTDAGTAWARATSGGSRGSRSISAPARRPAPGPAMPANPTSPSSRPSAQPGPAQRPGFFGSLMTGIAGFALGGLIGSMLFGGMGLGGGGGIGLLEILLVGVGAFLLIRMFRARQAAPAPAYAGGSASAYDGAGGTGGAVADVASGETDLDRGVGHIRQMDAAFDPDAFAQWAQHTFADVQDAITRRDLSLVADRLTPQEYARLQSQCDRLRQARQTNRVEQIEVRRVELTEAWQESGQDWATVYVAASLVDYTIDDTTGGVIDGSRTPQDIEEYWTFTRPVGPKPWRLSAIQTA